jgi:hypothetical protein
LVKFPKKKMGNDYFESNVRTKYTLYNTFGVPGKSSK